MNEIHVISPYKHHGIWVSMTLASVWRKSPSSPEPTPGWIVSLLISPTRRMDSR